MANAFNSLKNATLVASLVVSVATAAVGNDSIEALNIAVSNSYFMAFQIGDLETLGTLVAADVVWNQPVNNWFSGTQNDAEVVFGRIGGMMQISDGEGVQN